MLKKALNHARENHETYLKQLCEYLRIPSISTLPEHKADIERTARWLVAEMQRIGLKNVRTYPTNNNPMVYGEWLGAGDAAPTLLLYGHYDCQPIDPLNLWEGDPFGADIRDDKVFARGASDNKGQHFAHLKALDAMLSTSGALPVNIKILLEGEEEILSPNIESFLAGHKELLTADSGLISDGGMVSPGQPSIDYGLRGVAAVEIILHGPARDLHSGSYGGSVLNPVQALSEMLASLHDSEGRITIPGFYDQVRVLSDEERTLLTRVPFHLAEWQRDTGAKIPWGEPDFTLTERIGARPTCEINGIWGGFQGEGVKTIIPAEAGAKISMRLVPNQDPEEIIRLFTEHIQRITPSQVEVEIFSRATCSPALMPVDSPAVYAAEKAYEKTWGVPPVFILGGGSLPVVAAFQRLLGVPFVLMPLGLDDNRHAPNEHIRLGYFYKGIETAMRYYYYLGEG